MDALKAACLAVCLLVAVDCSDRGSTTGTEPEDQGYPFAVARAAGVEREQGATEAALLREQAASGNAFAVAMYHQLATEAGNLFFSPYSISAALGMTVAGARGDTERQIRDALEVAPEGEALHDALNGLEIDLEDHVGATDGVELSIVNSIWAQTGFGFEAIYLELLARAYGAGVYLLDFAAAPDASRLVINDWVSEQTRQRIEDLLPRGSISSQTRVVLTNAVYFLAEWLYRFDADLTTDETFTRLDRGTVSVPLMQLGDSGKQVEVEYARDEQVAARAINLYYRGRRLCMTVLLPDAGAFGVYERALSADGIEALTARLAATGLPPVRLPRFTWTSASVPLARALQVLGMRDAFDAGLADFSGIDGHRDLYVSEVYHKAFVAVDEQGTEAAAATAVVFDRNAVADGDPQFVADRPFIFMIRDTETGLILFMGRIVDPSQSA